MHLSFILSSLWLSGGERVFIEFANGLSSRGHQISLVLPGGALDQDMQGELDPRVRLHLTAMPRTTGRPGPLSLLRLAIQLARATPKSDFVVSTHTPTTVSGFIAARLLKKGQLIWLYQDYLEMFIGRPIETWLLKNALRWHRRALAVSTYSQGELQRYAPGDVRIVSEGLSHPDFFKPLALDQQSGGHGQKRTILTMGDTRPRKGFFDFIEAISLVSEQISDIHLWIFAKEPLQFHTDVSYEFFHRPARDALARLYASCDVFVSASWWESFGLPPLEAMACGAPVVMTDSRGVNEFARSGENCLMVPPRKPDLLAEAIVQVLSDPALESRLRQNGPSTAAEFTWDRAVDRFEQALQDL